MRLARKRVERSEEPICLAKLFQAFRVEPYLDKCGENAFDFKEFSWDLLELIEHSQNDFFLQI